MKILGGLVLRGCGADGLRHETVAGPGVTTTATVTATATATVTATPTKVIATKTATVRVTFTPAPVVAFTDGTLLVGTDVQPGTYKTPGSIGGANCYWERESSLGGGLGGIVANDHFTGPTTIQIAPVDKACKTNGGCDWTKVG